MIRSAMTRLLCMRLGTGQPGATLVTCILRDGSPRTQADMWSSGAGITASSIGEPARALLVIEAARSHRAVHALRATGVAAAKHIQRVSCALLPRCQPR